MISVMVLYSSCVLLAIVEIRYSFRAIDVLRVNKHGGDIITGDKDVSMYKERYKYWVSASETAERCRRSHMCVCVCGASVTSYHIYFSFDKFPFKQHSRKTKTILIYMYTCRWWTHATHTTSLFVVIVVLLFTRFIKWLNIFCSPIEGAGIVGTRCTRSKRLTSNL